MNAGQGKKVAFVITSMAGGGAEKAVLTLAGNMNALGHDARIIALRDVTQYDLRGRAPVHFLDREPEPPGGVSRAGRLAALVRRLEEREGRPFDLVVASLVEAYDLVARCDFPRVVYRLGNSIRGALRRARSRPIRYLRDRSRYRRLNGKRVVAVCRGLAEEIRSTPWLEPAGVQAIYNAVDVEDIRRRAEEPVPGIPEGPFVLHVGRAARQKRHDLLFRAFRQVPEPYKLVLLAGRPEKLTILLARYGLRRRALLPGFQQNPYAWMRRAALTVLSSDFEGLPGVLSESLAVGTPVVSTDCPHGPSEILTGELAHWLVPVGDARALGRRMVEALHTEIDVSDPESLRRFSPETVTRQYLSLAEEIGPES